MPLVRKPFAAPMLPVVLVVIAATFATGAAAQSASYPPAPKRPVTDTYIGTHGPQKVVDDYRWLENLDDPAVRDWITAENAATRRVLDALPSRAAIRDELRRLYGTAPVARYAFRFEGGRLFALKRQPPKNQPMLVVLDGDPSTADVLDGERVVVDPNQLNDKGTTAIDWFVPSHDGRFVAVSMSDNGSEKGSLHLYDARSGEALPDVVPRVQSPTGAGSVAWNGDGTGIWYTRYPAPMERAAEDAGFYQQVWFHRIGTPVASDRLAFGGDLPRIAEIALESTVDGRHVLASVRNGDGGQVGFWLRGPDDHWRRLAGFDDGVRDATFGRDGRIYATTIAGAPRGRVVAIRLDAPTFANAATIVPQSDATIESIAPTRTRLYVGAMVGGPSEIRVYTLAGKSLPAPPVEPVSSATLGVRLGGDAILFGDQSYVTPFAWYLLDPAHREPLKTALSAPPDDLAMGPLSVVRVMATSKDGTAVPVNIVSAKDAKLDGRNPVLLTAYGGYGASTRPRYSRRTMFWLRHGGVFAVANVRGGNEFGDDWHTAGNLLNKQNVFDDFAASARMLIERGTTTPKRLVIEGGSNGGLLMGAELVQHPELFGAVVSHVGIYDMLRVELTSNGAFNVTEFGSVKVPAQFDALYAYSPLQHVVDGVDYPPMLMTTGINDGRVDPWQSLKMTARLQAANPHGRPVLLRVAGDAGHGQGMSLSSAIELDADTFAFVFDSLGLPFDAAATVRPGNAGTP